MRIRATGKGVEIEFSSIADAAMKGYVLKHGKRLAREGGAWLRLTQAKFNSRPGVATPLPWGRFTAYGKRRRGRPRKVLPETAPGGDQWEEGPGD
jgi:hypothetical protein